MFTKASSLSAHALFEELKACDWDSERLLLNLSANLNMAAIQQWQDFRMALIAVALLRGDDEAGSPSVLLQEELRGREWVVDSVSRDGEHKVVALWRYSKASLNGAPSLPKANTAAQYRVMRR